MKFKDYNSFQDIIGYVQSALSNISDEIDESVKPWQIIKLILLYQWQISVGISMTFAYKFLVYLCPRSISHQYGGCTGNHKHMLKHIKKHAIPSAFIESHLMECKYCGKLITKKKNHFIREPWSFENVSDENQITKHKMDYI